tara:strand:+ start:701 stop:1078 length:378 start_codon:yes stop_codon:yes gene_type:complete
MKLKEYIHKNLTGNTAQTLFKNDKNKDISITGMTLSNVHATDTVYVDLFLREKLYIRQNPIKNWDLNTNTYRDYYIMKKIEITNENTLILEPREVDYDSRKYDLMVQLSSADSKVDLMMNFRKEY